LSLLSCKETHYRDGYVKHHTALARIVHGSMIVREQKIVMVPLAKPSLTQGIQRVTVCPHISLIWNQESRGLHDIVKRVKSLRWDVPRIEWNCQGLVTRCPHCPTEFSLEFEQFGEKAEALFVTKWLDLGQGRSPMDYKWQSHLTCSEERLWQSIELDRGSGYAIFQRKEHFWFESTSLLTQRDKKELLGLLEHT
jgi:hypothetical protein